MTIILYGSEQIFSRYANLYVGLDSFFCRLQGATTFTTGGPIRKLKSKIPQNTNNKQWIVVVFTAVSRKNDNA